MEDILITYKSETGPSAFSLYWGNNAFGNERTSLPKDTLCFPRGHVLGSPFVVSVQAGAVSPDGVQLISAPAEVLRGQIFEVDFWAGDSYNNSVRDAATSLAVRLDPPVGLGASPVRLTTREGVAERFLEYSGARQVAVERTRGVVAAGAAPTSAGTHTLFSAVAVIGGLHATYYAGDAPLAGGAAVSSRTDATLDFSAPGGAKPAATLGDAEAYSVRWTGLVRPAAAQTYTFFAAVQTDAERIKLWVDNQLLVQQWRSLDSLERSGTISFDAADGYYQVAVVYMHPTGTGAAQGAVLSWEGASLSKEVIPSDALFQAHETPGSGTHIEVLGEAVDPSQSRASGACLTLATSGAACSFTITLRDKYGEPTAPTGGELLVFVASEDAQEARATSPPLCDSSGRCTASFTPRADDTLLVSVQHGVSGQWAHLRGSPFSVPVLRGRISLSGASAHGEGISLTTAGATATFLLVLRDSFGARAPSWPMPVSELPLALDVLPLGGKARGRVALAVQISEAAPGAAALSFRLTMSGSYLISVRGADAHISGSPFALLCEPGVARRDARYSIALLAAVAGEPLTFEVAARDEFGNRGTSQTLRAFSRSPGSRNSNATVVPLGDSGFQVTVLVTGTGNYSVQLRADVGFGLAATYYAGDFVERRAARVDASVDFSSSSASFVPAATLTAAAQYSVRWSGLVRPQSAGEYTFHGRVSSASDRMKLWVDNSLLIDQWASLAATEAAATLSVGTVGPLLDVLLEYRHEAGINDQGATLSWEAAALSKTAIGAANLVATADFLDGYPLVATAGAQCASASTVQGLSASLWTAGILFSFSVLSRDAFGNSLAPGATLPYTFELSPLSGDDVTTNLTAFSYTGLDGEWAVATTATRSGTYEATVRISGLAGLAATYYADAFLRTPVANSLDAVVDNAWGASAPHSLVNADYFSARWTGMLTPTESAEYVFHLYADDCAILFLSGEALLDSCVAGVGVACTDCMPYPGRYRRATRTLTAGLQDAIDLKCMETVGDAVCRLLWSRGQETAQVVPTTVLSTPLVASGGFLGPITVKSAVVAAGTDCAADGAGLTAATSGVRSSFRVLCRDVYGNIPDVFDSPGTTLVGALRPPSGAAAVPATLLYTGAGRYEGSYTAVFAAEHALHLSLPTAGGLAATYYDAGCCFSIPFVRGHRIPDVVSSHVFDS